MVLGMIVPMVMAFVVVTGMCVTVSTARVNVGTVMLVVCLRMRSWLSGRFR
jgi:hypothetical protein